MAGRRPRPGSPHYDRDIAINALDYGRKQEELIINTLLNLRNKGDVEITRYVANQKLKQIAGHADLTKPDQVKAYIDNATHHKTKQPLANASKAKLATAYDNLCKANGMEWMKPVYKVPENVPMIPTKDAVTKIIASCKIDYKTIFTIMAEIGCSPEELHSTPRNKIHTETNTIDIIGHKGHGSAPYKLKPTTAEMLKAYLETHRGEYPFPRARNRCACLTTHRFRAEPITLSPATRRVLVIVHSYVVNTFQAERVRIMLGSSSRNSE